MKKLNFLILFLTLSPAFSAQNKHEMVDLHAHLFMKEALGWFFSGAFFEDEIRANHWSDRFSSQANPKTVNESGIGLLVVALYAHPLFTWNMRQTIREQIQLAQRFVRENPEWILAKTPDEAWKAYTEGKRVMLLSLEGVSGILETMQDIDEFYDLGVRIVTFSHFTDDDFGGAALLTGMDKIANPFAWLWSKTELSDGKKIKRNPKGLSEKGYALLRELIQRKIWIDLTHASDAAQEEMMPLLKKAGQPFLYTHVGLRKYLGSERGISLKQLVAVRQTGGIVGVTPSPKLLAGTFEESDQDAQIEAFIRQYNEAARIIGSPFTMTGSDFNGAIAHLSPSPAVRDSSLEKRGLYHIGQEGELWNLMKKNGASISPKPGVYIDTFLKAWAKVF